MKRIKRFGALCMALCLFAGGAMAAVPGLDQATAGYLDIADDVKYTLTAQFAKLPPYGDQTVEMINAVLTHLSVTAAHRAEQTDVAILADGESMMTFSEQTMENGTALKTDLLKNRTLVSASSAMDQLSGAAQREEPAFDALAAFADAKDSYQALTDAIIPYATEKKANYKIKNVGASKWSRIARLTPEQSRELAPLIAQVLGSGMDAAYRDRLQELTYGKGFIVGLYQTEEGGEDIAVYMKGSVSFPEGGTAQLSYQWAFAETDEKRVDTYKFTLSKSKAASTSREITAKYTRTQKDGGYDLKGDSSARVAVADESHTTTVKHALECRETDGARTLSGEVVTTQKLGDDSATTTVTPSLTLTAAEGSGVLSGTVDMERKEGQKTALGVTLTFAQEVADAFVAAAESGELYAVADTEEMPPSSLDQNEEPVEPTVADYLVGQPPIGLRSFAAPQTPQIVDLDTLDASQRETLLAEAAQQLAGRLLVALSRLPAEEIALVSDNMSEEDFAAFLELVKGL